MRRTAVEPLLDKMRPLSAGIDPAERQLRAERLIRHAKPRDILRMRIRDLAGTGRLLRRRHGVPPRGARGRGRRRRCTARPSSRLTHLNADNNDSGSLGVAGGRGLPAADRARPSQHDRRARALPPLHADRGGHQRRPARPLRRPRGRPGAAVPGAVRDRRVRQPRPAPPARRQPPPGRAPARRARSATGCCSSATRSR